MRRVLNELPTLVVVILEVIGVSEADAAMWVELVTALCSFGLWLLVRASIDGPVTLADDGRLMLARSEQGHGPPIQTLVWVLAIVVFVLVILYLAKGL